MKKNLNNNLHEVAITAIIKNKNKFLLIRRSSSKKRFPGYWTVPGGKVETSDYTRLKRDKNVSWQRYDQVLEKTLAREIKEEVGIKTKNFKYLTSLAVIHEGGIPSIVISCSANYVSGKIRLQEKECDKYAWVTLSQAKKFKLLGGIYKELKMAGN